MDQQTAGVMGFARHVLSRTMEDAVGRAAAALRKEG